jgi:hypothetical protein
VFARVVCGITLPPFGSFDQNPVIDLPWTMNAASCCTSAKAYWCD